MANHTRFVEVFGGGAAVLFNKPPSEYEVYNDIDGDLTTFFTVLRNRPDELMEWLKNCPFSREYHEKWATQFYETEERPDDPVEYAGRFFFVRYSQYNGVNGDKTSLQHYKGDKAKIFRQAVETLPKFAERFSEVTVEQVDYRDLISTYDGEDTLFYFDPLFLDGSSDDLFKSGTWNPQEFVDTMDRVEGRWQVSCLKDEIPQEWLDDPDIHYVQREYKDYMETIQMNYDYRAVPSIRDANAMGGNALKW